MEVPVKKEKKSHYISIIFLSIIFTLIACADGGSGNGDIEGSDTEVETIRSGLWSGNTGFGSVEFNVTSDSTGIESFEVNFSEFKCGTITHGGGITVTYTPADNINDRQIEIDISIDPMDNDYLLLEGTFEDSGDYISGTFELDNGVAVCSGTWDAQPD
jgi:hypothetical protein